MSDTARTIQGEPMVRTVPMPADANANGDIFGGWVLSQMDIAGGICAEGVVHGRLATVAVEGMKFHKPIAVGDLVSLYAEVERVGRTSVTVHIETMVRRRDHGAEIKVTEGVFIYVAIDESGTAIPIKS